jgi:signal transduction histidine kinase
VSARPRRGRPVRRGAALGRVPPRAALVATLYFVTAWLGLVMHATASASITLIWAPAGIAVASVLLWGRWMLPGVYVGALAINATTGDANLPAAVAIAAGNTAEAFVVCLALRRFGFTLSIERVAELAPLPVAATVGCAVAATVGTTALEATHALSVESWPLAWVTWWLGDQIGIFLVVPVALALAAARSGVHVEPLTDHRIRLAGVEALRRLRERERRRWARELHEQTLQGLSAAKDILAISSPPEAVQRASTILGTEIACLRALIAELRPPPLEQMGLGKAIESLAETLSERYGLEIEVAIELGDAPLPVDIETAIYRAAQEALTNAAKHSRAERAQVLLTANLGRAGVHLLVQDDGVGFDPTQISGGYGLIGLRERMLACGGTAEIHSAPAHGTRVQAACPASGLGALA